MFALCVAVGVQKLAPAGALAQSAELEVTKTSGSSVTAGGLLTYDITVDNHGPDPAANLQLSDSVSAGTTFVSFTAPGGWTTTTPAVGSTGTVTATIASMPAGTTAGFTLVVEVCPPPGPAPR